MLATGGAIPGGLGPGDDPDFLGGGGGYENFIDDGKQERNQIEIRTQHNLEKINKNLKMHHET